VVLLRPSEPGHIDSNFPFTRDVHERQVAVPDRFPGTRGTGDREANQADSGAFAYGLPTW